MPEFAYDVFLSHSSKDKAVVRAVAERLRADGLRVWFDEWEIKAGDSIPAKLEEGLEHSRVLVLCMSASAFGSDWTQLEAGTFRFRDPLNQERRFIPLRLDDAPIKGSLAQFFYINWLPADREHEYAKLLEACRPTEKHVRSLPGAIRSFGVDPHQYPPEVQSMLLDANRFELNGDFWDAQAKFDEAIGTLQNCRFCGVEMVAALTVRSDFNWRLGEDLRREYKGTAEPTLVKVFDEQNRYLYSKPKKEVHTGRLLHHTVILLVHVDGQVVFYRRHRLQTFPNKLDFFGGHTADVDSSPADTARREANEELQLYAHGNRLRIPDHWIHLVGDEHQFVWNAPENRERSTLFVVELPRHPGISLRVSDEAADGQRIVSIPDYEVDSLSNLLKAYTSRQEEFADGAERVLIEIERNNQVRMQLARWFPDIVT
ncbi:MAG: TIR domain-containing protein [Planctomycetota bacterium]